MINHDWIELFFSESYEKQINDMILDDIDYEVPLNQLQNYVETIIAIPYKEFVNYARSLSKVSDDFIKDIPQKNVFVYTDYLIDFFAGEDNRGIDAEELLNESWYNFGDTKGFASMCLKAFSVLGIVYEYYGLWYINCLGYVLPSITGNDRTSLYARLLLRRPFYRNALLTQHIFLYDTLKGIDIRFTDNLYTATKFLFECIDGEAKVNGITFHLDCKTPTFTRKNNKVPSLRASWYYKNILKQLEGIPYTKSIEKILNTIKFLPYYTHGHLSELRENYRNGDKAAYDELILAGQSIVLTESIEYIHTGLDIDDIIQEAEFGLIRAVDLFVNNNFDHFSFFKCIYLNVRFFISQAIYTNSMLVQIPILRKKDRKFTRLYVNDFVQRNHFTPLTDDVCSVVNKRYQNRAYTEENFSYFFNLAFMDHEFSDGGIVSNANLLINKDIDALYAEDVTYTDYNLMRESEIMPLNIILNKLRCSYRRDIDIVCMFYGIGYKYTSTLETIGDKYGITRERARQIFVKTIDLLKETFKEIKKNKLQDNIKEEINSEDISMCQENDQLMQAQSNQQTDIKSNTKEIKEPTSVKKNYVENVIPQEKIKKQVAEIKVTPEKILEASENIDFLYPYLTKEKGFSNRKLIYMKLFIFGELSIKEIIQKTKLSNDSVIKELYEAMERNEIFYKLGKYSLAYKRQSDVDSKKYYS